MQKITIIGHLGKDAQVREVGEDTVISFAVAHNSEFVDKSTGEYIKKTQWFSCSFWQDSEVYKFLKAGTQVYVEGEISAETYINKKGLVEIDLRVRVSKLLLLGKPQQAQNTTATSTQVTENQTNEQPF